MKAVPPLKDWNRTWEPRVLEVMTIFPSQEVFPQAIFLFSLER
jgi:hypothetical protein